MTQDPDGDTGGEPCTTRILILDGFEGQFCPGNFIVVYEHNDEVCAVSSTRDASWLIQLKMCQVALDRISALHTRATDALTVIIEEGGDDEEGNDAKSG